MNEDEQRWKQKYFDKLDEFDSISASYEQKVKILERLLVRVSLTAAGIDEKLDDELANLRKIIRRKDSDPQALIQQLQTIEQQILLMDKDQLALTDNMGQALSALLEPLLKRDVSRQNKKELKRIQKHLARKDNKFRHYPALIEDITVVQKTVIGAISKGDQQASSGGMLRRFFGPSPPDPSLTEPSQNLQLANPGHMITPADADAETSGVGSAEPGFSSVSEHVCSTLEGLIEQLQLPEAMAQDTERVRQKIATGMNWHEFIPTLDDIANLVIAAFGKGQQDFESFLKALDVRLVGIQGFLELNQSTQLESSQNKQELQQLMHGRISNIREEAATQADVGKLKSTVQTDLDAIAASLERFMQQESVRERYMATEIEVLQERLGKMEVDSMKIQQQLLEQQEKAMTDGLTGLPNRVAYEQRVQLEFERWKRYGSPLTMVIADIDKFKNINDRFGHLSGDKVIQLIGREVAERIRKTDFIARFGGEEFLILLPETDGATAFKVMDKAREMIARMPFHFQNQRVQVTISMGLCEFFAESAINDVFELADEALYRAKSSGRNQVQSNLKVSDR